MLKNQLHDTILQHLHHKPTSGQSHFIKMVAEYVADDDPGRVLVLKGYAGTGKTTVIAALVSAMKALRYKFFLMAPTGRAAKVITNYSHNIALTIHKKIYRQKSAKDGFGSFVLNRNLHTNTLFVVDEASMISNSQAQYSVFGSGNLLNDLYEYVSEGRGCKLLIVGDTAQLPPVGLTESPALQSNVIEGYYTDCLVTELTEVLRQAQHSQILSNATRLRLLIGDNKQLMPVLSPLEQGDLVALNGNDLLEQLMYCYDTYGMENTIVITRSNKRANKYNQGIRQQILFKDNEIDAGDYLMVVKNNYFWIEDSEKADFIANGDIAEVQRIIKYDELYGFRFAEVQLYFHDYDIELTCKILLDTLTTETAALSSDENKKLFYSILEDYTHLPSRKQQYDAVKNNPYFNALQVKFSYAITCHKAQGGQWMNVFIDQGYITDEQLNNAYYRWLYTALTRATKKVYLVNFPEKFLQRPA